MASESQDLPLSSQIAGTMALITVEGLLTLLGDYRPEALERITLALKADILWTGSSRLVLCAAFPPCARNHKLKK